MSIGILGSRGGSATPSHPYLYLPDGWDTGWKAAKAASGTTPCWVTAWGDSITAGNASTYYLTNGYLGIIRSSLIASLGAYADFHIATLGNANNSVNTPVLPFTYSAGWSIVGQTGFGSSMQTTTAAATLTYVSPNACIGLDILYHDRFTGTPGFSYTVDGGSSVNVNQTASGIKRITIRGLSNAAHTIVITFQSAAINIIGCVSYQSLTSGVGIGNCGIGSQQSSAWLLLAQQLIFAERATGMTAPFGIPTGAALTILAMGINDCAAGAVGPEQYYQTYSRVIQAIRRRDQAASILLLAPSLPNVSFSDMTSGSFGNPGDWPVYVNANQRLARDWNCAFFNVNAKWGTTSVAQGFHAGVDGHPTNAGHVDIGTTILGVL